MERKNAIRILVALALLVALGFGLFYFFVIQEGGGDQNGLTVREGEGAGNPIYGENGNPLGGGTIDPETGLPYGSGTIRDTEQENGSGSGTSTGGVVNNVPITSLGSVFLISAAPTSGATSYTKQSVGSTVVRYVERELGRIYDFTIGGGGSERISIETIPRLQEAFFLDGGSSLIGRYLDRDGTTVLTYRARLVLSSGTSSNRGMYELEGSFLPENISDVSVSLDRLSAFYIRPHALGAGGYVIPTPQSSPRVVFDSPAREWSSSWMNNRSLVLSTRPAAGVIGFAYLLDTETEVLSELMSPREGLVARPNSTQSHTLFMESGQGLRSFIMNRSQTLLNFSVNTLPEKCVWSTLETTVLFCAVPTAPKGSALPDDWYQGVAVFDDEIWKFDVVSGTSERIASTNQFNGNTVDVFRPFLTKDEKYFIFTNKKDLSLWGVRVGE